MEPTANPATPKTNPKMPPPHLRPPQRAIANLTSSIVGWNNPLLIGQARGVAPSKSGPCLRPGWKKVYPVAGPVRGQSSLTMGPWTYHIHISPPNSPPLSRDHHASYTWRSPFSYNSRSSFSHPPPLLDPLAPKLPPRDTSAVTISLARAAATFPMPPAVEQSILEPRGGYGPVFPWMAFFSFSYLFFFPFSLI